jgi:hypothetical protein
MFCIGRVVIFRGGIVGREGRSGVGSVCIILSSSCSIVESVGSWNCGNSPTNGPGCSSLAATDEAGGFAIQLVEIRRNTIAGMEPGHFETDA